MSKVAPPVPDGHQWCHGCKQALPMGSFYVDRRKPRGLTSRCRGCISRTRRDGLVVRDVIEEAAQRIMAQQSTPTPIPDDYAPAVIQPWQIRAG